MSSVCTSVNEPLNNTGNQFMKVFIEAYLVRLHVPIAYFGRQLWDNTAKSRQNCAVILTRFVAGGQNVAILNVVLPRSEEGR